MSKPPALGWHQRAKGSSTSGRNCQPISASTCPSAPQRSRRARASATCDAVTGAASPTPSPASSSVSRIAAMRAVRSSWASRWPRATSSGARAMARSPSAGSTRPPGKTAAPPAKRIALARWSIRISGGRRSGGPLPAPWRKTTRVAAGMEAGSLVMPGHFARGARRGKRQKGEGWGDLAKYGRWAGIWAQLCRQFLHGRRGGGGAM